MAFFDLPPDEELSPETSQMLEEYRRLIGSETVASTWRAFGRSPKIIEARFKAVQNLNFQSSFPWDARCIATMLIAHARRCRGCFAGAQRQLDKLGFNEETMEAMCAAPESLPLKERDRLFVHYALKIATGAADLQPKDFKEMAQHGFSKAEVQEIIAFAAYWCMNTVFTSAALAALADD
jgi:alkylhydroperoxidase family enzyme